MALIRMLDHVRHPAPCAMQMRCSAAPNLKTVIFDVDGTLADTEWMWNNWRRGCI